MRRYCLMLAVLVGSGLVSREALADAWLLDELVPSATPTTNVVDTAFEGSETVVYDDGVFATTAPDAYGSPSGYAGFPGCGACCEPPCVRGFGGCLAGLRRCCERIRAKLASLCRPRTAYAAYYDPSCCVPEPTCAIEPSCYVSEPSCGVAEPWCGIEPSCGVVSYYRPLGCGERLRAFCQRVRCRLFGWFRFRRCCPYCGEWGTVAEPCTACSGSTVTTLPGEPVYQTPPQEVDSSEMVPVPSVKLRLPRGASDNEGGADVADDDRVAIGTIRLTLVRRR